MYQIACEDPIIHTSEHPECLDASCPCHEKEATMIAIPRHPNYHKNYRRTGSSYLQHCIVCGRAISFPRFMVHVVNGGASLATEEEALKLLDDSGYLGLHPLGTDCLKSHPELKPYAAQVIYTDQAGE